MTASPESIDVVGSRGGRIPDFFIVGHAKCGTTALYETLRRHPQIFMPDFKEPMFFARNHTPPASPEVKEFTQTGRRSETLDQYRALFAPAAADQRVGEASTFYLWSQVAPQRIAERQPGAKIIAILREPAGFLSSLHLQMLQNHAETERSLLRAIELEPVRREGREIPRNAYWPEALMYSERVRYVEQLERYRAVFAESQMLVLIYDDFRADNAGTLRRVLRFLDVDEDVTLKSVEANPSVGVRSVHFNALVREVRQGQGPLSRGLRAAIRGGTSSGMRRSVLYPLRRRMAYGAPVAPGQSTIAELRVRFRGEVEAISEYLGRDLVAEWGYGRG